MANKKRPQPLETAPTKTSPWIGLSQESVKLAKQNSLIPPDWLSSLAPATAERLALSLLQEDREMSHQAYCQALENSNHSSAGIGLIFAMPLNGELLKRKRRQEEWDEKVTPERIYLNYLEQECRLLGALINRRRAVVNLFWPAEMTQLLRPEEMTELMYCLSRNFSLLFDGSGHYCFELPGLPLDEGLLPLIRGLGFSNLLVNLNPQTESTKDLTSFIGLARRYGFRNLSIRLSCNFAGGVSTALKTVLETLTKHQVSAIELRPQQCCDRIGTETSISPDLDAWICTQGYCQHGTKGRYQLNSLAEPPANSQLLGLGLGAFSLVDNLYAVNVGQLDRYFAQLDQQRIPFDRGGYVHWPSA